MNNRCTKYTESDMFGKCYSSSWRYLASAEIADMFRNYTVKPVCNDHLYNKIHYLWFIQECALMKAECTNLLLLTISAF